MPPSWRTDRRARATSLESLEDNVSSVVDWRDVGRRRWTLHVQFVRTSKNLLLVSVFVALMLDQLLWTSVGKCDNLSLSILSYNPLHLLYSYYFIGTTRQAKVNLLRSVMQQ